jgi:hypothetical protein
MRVGDTVPPIGTTFDWDIAEILERRTGDMSPYWAWCTMCDAQFDDDHEPLDESEVGCASWDECDPQPDPARSWDYLMEDKEGSEHFDDLVESLERHGLIIPLSATVVDDQLAFGDGHHRLVAAYRLGWESVRVTVRPYREHISESSGDYDWRLGDPIDTEFVSRAEARRRRMHARAIAIPA